MWKYISAWIDKINILTLKNVILIILFNLIIFVTFLKKLFQINTEDYFQSKNCMSENYFLMRHALSILYIENIFDKQKSSVALEIIQNMENVYNNNNNNINVFVDTKSKNFIKKIVIYNLLKKIKNLY